MESLSQRILRALSRVTSSGQLIPVIDGLRFLAIASVVMVHLLEYVIVRSPVGFDQTLQETSILGGVLTRGRFGVQLFFVISGFVIFLPFAQYHLAAGRSVSLRNYFLRRLTRIEPPYILCATICFVLTILTRRESFAALLPHYLSTVTYSHNIVHAGRNPITAVAWSLEIEIQFYVLAPLIAYVFAISSKVARRGLLAAMIVGACALQPVLRDGVLTVAGFIQFFLTGFLLTDIYVSDWHGAPKRTAAMDWVAIFAIAALYVLSGDYDRYRYDPVWCALSCAGLLLLCYTAFRGKVFSRFLSFPWIVVIGGMCYTIYLYHELIFSLVGHLMIRAHFTHELWVNYGIAWILMIPTMLVVASLLFVLFEKPFMQLDWLQRLRTAILGAAHKVGHGRVQQLKED